MFKLKQLYKYILASDSFGYLSNSCLTFLSYIQDIHLSILIYITVIMLNTYSYICDTSLIILTYIKPMCAEIIKLILAIIALILAHLNTIVDIIKWIMKMFYFDFIDPVMLPIIDLTYYNIFYPLLPYINPTILDIGNCICASIWSILTYITLMLGDIFSYIYNTFKNLDLDIKEIFEWLQNTKEIYLDFLFNYPQYHVIIIILLGLVLIFGSTFLIFHKRDPNFNIYKLYTLILLSLNIILMTLIL